jgi:hypothetical protein
VLEIEKKLCVKFFGPEVEGLTPVPSVEKRYWAKWADGLQHSGQLDRVHRKGTKALIIDVKSLAGEVAESPKNDQLRDQACLFKMNNVGILEIGVAIAQPLATHSPELCVYSVADLERAQTEMYLRVQMSNNPESPRIAGPVQCKYCKAKKVCKEYNAWAGSMVPAPKSLVDVPVHNWSPEMRASFCDNYSVAQKWLDGCWEAMESGARLHPDFVPGYALKDNTPKSSIVNLQKVFDRASEKGIPLADFLERSTITKTNLTELARHFGKLKGKALDKAVETIIGDDVKLSAPSQSLKKV